MEGVEKMFKCIINKFRKNSINTINSGTAIDDILKNKAFYNPFERFKKSETRYKALKKIVFHMNISYYKLRQLTDIDVLGCEEFSYSNSCRVDVRISDYIKMYENQYNKALHEKLIYLQNHYNNLPKENKLEFDASYMESLISIKNAINETITDKLMMMAIEVIDLILNDIKEENEIVVESHVDKLKFELEYLKQIKETRESIFNSVK